MMVLAQKSSFETTLVGVVVAVALGVIVITLGRALQVYYVTAPRKQLVAAECPVFGFSARLDPRSYRWLSRAIRWDVLPHFTAQTLAVLISNTGISFWWASSVMPPRNLYTVNWAEVVDVTFVPQSRFDRKVRIQLRDSLDLWLVVGGGSFFPANRNITRAYVEGITRAKGTAEGSVVN